MEAEEPKAAPKAPASTARTEAKRAKRAKQKAARVEAGTQEAVDISKKEREYSYFLRIAAAITAQFPVEYYDGFVGMWTPPEVGRPSQWMRSSQ